MVHSFAIHVAQCQELFDKREALKPPKERRKCPSDPMANYAPSSSSGKNMSQRELDHMNALSQQQWSNEALMPCGNCGRRFLAEKLPIHQRSCTADHPSRRVNEPVARGQTASSYGTTQAGPAGSGNGGYSGPDEYEYANSVTVAGFNQCRSCGRRFNDLAYEKYVVYMLSSRSADIKIFIIHRQHRHIRICSKLQKPRKVFDSAKHRAMGTELEQFQGQTRRTKVSSTMKSTNTLGSTTGIKSRTAEMAGLAPQCTYFVLI
jgi:hypothetical protein